MNTATPQNAPYLAKLAQVLAVILSPRSIARKLYTITAIALAVIVLLGGMTFVTLRRLGDSEQQVMIMYEQAQRAENLFKKTLFLSEEVRGAGKTGNIPIISNILAESETLTSDFANYRSVAEEYDLENDATFIVENESLILQIREDIYQALNLYRTGTTGDVAQIQERLDRNIRHLATAIERSATQRQVSIGNEAKLLEELRQQQIWFILGIFSVGAVILFVASFGYARSIVANLHHLITSADEIATGNYAHRIQTKSSDEVARIAISFNHMATSVEERQEQVLQQQQTIEQRARELEQTLLELRSTIEERDQLTDSIRELSSPVLPISNGILAMPLIGVIDTERAALMTQTLLTAIERHGADMVILDVTGVPIIDTQVARVLLQAAEAAKLLGAQTILVGIRPELAQTIVGLGVNLSTVVTQADLQTGIMHALQQHRRQARGATAVA